MQLLNEINIKMQHLGSRIYYSTKICKYFKQYSFISSSMRYFNFAVKHQTKTSN